MAGFLVKTVGMLLEYGVDGRLSLAVESLHFFSAVCVRFGAVKSQPFTVYFKVVRCHHTSS